MHQDTPLLHGHVYLSGPSRTVIKRLTKGTPFALPLSAPSRGQMEQAFEGSQTQRLLSFQGLQILQNGSLGCNLLHLRILELLSAGKPHF